MDILFLMLHQNLVIGSFLKFSYNVESETTIVNFFVLCYIKIHWSIIHNFVTSLAIWKMLVQ